MFVIRDFFLLPCEIVQYFHGSVILELNAAWLKYSMGTLTWHSWMHYTTKSAELWNRLLRLDYNAVTI